MQPDQQAPSIDRLWHLTKAIEHAAAVGEWEEAARLATERSPQLVALAQAALGEIAQQQTQQRTQQQTPAMLETLKQIHDIDRQIAHLARGAQSALSTEYQAAMQATRHVGLYQKVARF